MERIKLFADGSAYYKTKIGGLAVVLICGEYYKEISQGYYHTTNNRMELMAVIVGLEALKKPNSNVIVYSDSEYVVNAINRGYLKKWIRNDFYKKSNVDLWKRFYEIFKKHNVEMEWIKGHSGVVFHNICDANAYKASKSENLEIDISFEEMYPDVNWNQ